MNKRVTALVSMITLMLSMLCAVPAAAGSAEAVFSLEMPAATAITTDFTVDLKLSGNPGLSGAVLKLDYNTAVFTLEKIEAGALCGENALIVWDPAKPELAVASPDIIAGNGVLLRLTFRVAETVTADDYEIKVSAVELRDGNLADFTASPAAKEIYVQNYLWGDANGDKVTNVADVQTVLKWKVALLEDDDLNMIAADADRNGSVGLTDALILLQYLAGYVEWDINGATTPPTAI